MIKRLQIALVFVFGLMSFSTTLNAVTFPDFGLERQAFEYKQILNAYFDIPNPAGSWPAAATAIYSPYVVKRSHNKYVMFFGVSINCNGSNPAYRDSIAYAESPDGVNNWVFMGYIIEPDPRTCENAGTQEKGFLYQVNDPSVVFQNNHYYVLYTSVFHRSPIDYHNGNSYLECGHIGTAIFDAEMKLVYRNDKYLTPSDTDCWIYSGFSRPAHRQTGPGSYELWYDSSTHLRWVPITAVDVLVNPIKTQCPHTQNPWVECVGNFAGVVGGRDYEVLSLDKNYKLILSTGAPNQGVNFLIGDNNGNVSVPWRPFTRFSGQIPDWDGSWGQNGVSGGHHDAWFPTRLQSYKNYGGEHGSPQVFFDKESCTTRTYFGAGKYGVNANVTTPNIVTVNIGVAIPKNDLLGQKLCSTRSGW